MFDHPFHACALGVGVCVCVCVCVFVCVCMCVCVFEVEISSRTLIQLFYARINPQWLSELRRLWPDVSTARHKTQMLTNHREQTTHPGDNCDQAQ